MQFIDIHGHYAWDIDDGIPSLEDAKIVLELARQNNIITIVATPHIIPEINNISDIKNIKYRIQELKVLAKKFKIDILEGSELFLNHDCIKAIHKQLFIPIEKTNYLLVEFDVRKELGYEEEVEDYLYEIEMVGYTPIIAHIERYFKKEVNIARIQNMINNGYIIQINSSSLLGVHGKTIKKNAYELIDRGLVHIIASDTHSCDGKRIPNLQYLFNILLKKYNYQTLKTLMFDNPQSILKNESVQKINAKQSFLKKLLKVR